MKLIIPYSTVQSKVDLLVDSLNDELDLTKEEPYKGFKVSEEFCSGIITELADNLENTSIAPEEMGNNILLTSEKLDGESELAVDVIEEEVMNLMAVRDMDSAYLSANKHGVTISTEPEGDYSVHMTNDMADLLLR